ncbi:MAG: mechanosensitive ion channel [Flavobacteriales bacterium]|nr:mechanosensitive ion channel [Flavobacteriales bacterium]
MIFPNIIYLLQNVAEAADTTAKKYPTLKELVESVKGLSTEQIITSVIHGLMSAIFHILLATIIFYIGRWLIRRADFIINKIFDHRDVDASLRSFLLSMFNAVATFLLLIIVIGFLGVDTSSFIALFASAGLAVGMALSGTLQNFAGGVLVLLLKPYRVGDFIEAQGQTGTVKAITLFSTVLATVDNKNIILPNGGMSTGIINNYSKEDKRRVDWTFSIAYGDDYDTAKKVLAEMLEKDSRVLKDPEYFIALGALADSSVNITVRAWVSSTDYWGLFFDMNERVYKEFPKHSLNIPFPQMDIHMSN